MATSPKVIDFSNVREGGTFNKRRIPSGDYLMTITKCDDAEVKSGDNKGTFQYLFTLKPKNKHTDRAFPYYCQLKEDQLWKLRNLAIAAGLNVPKKKMKFDPSKVIGRTVGVTLEDDEYEGKAQSTIVAIFPAAEMVEGAVTEADDDDTPEDDEDESIEEETEDEVEEETEEEDEDTADEYDGMDRTALKAALKARDASFQAKKSQTDDDLRDLLRAGDVDAEPEEEEEEEEPEPTPPPKAKKKKAKAATVTDEELEELDIDDV